MINFSIIVIMDVVCSAARNTGTEMRTLKIILIICLVLVTAAFAAGQVYSRVVADTVPPVILSTRTVSPSALRTGATRCCAA